ALHLGPRDPQGRRSHAVETPGLLGHEGTRTWHGYQASGPAGASEPPGPVGPSPTARAVGRRNPAAINTSAPITMQESAALNTGHTWKSMKSLTWPDTPGPWTIRSVRFPSAPPRINPRPTADETDRSRNDAATIARLTARLAVKNTHG